MPPSPAGRAEIKSGYAILGIALALGVAIRLIVIRFGVEVADVEHAHGIIDYFLSGKDPYSLPPFQSNYPPGALGIEAASVFITRLSGIPFYVVFKLWSVAADIVVGLLLFDLLRRERRTPQKAALWTLAFFLNPVSILITAAHGQLDPVTNCLCLVGLALLLRKPSKWYALSALSLGVAIAIKPNPVLLLPIFATARGLSIRQRVAYVIVASLPTAVSLVPFMLDNANGVITNIFGYPGEYDFGYAAVLRAAWFMKIGSAWLPGTVGPDLGQASRVMFIAIYLAALALGAGRISLAKLVTIEYVAFQAFFTGLSAQYTVWVVPFAILAGDWFVIVYSIAAAGSLMGFYLLFWPSILLGKFNTLKPVQAAFGPLYFWTMLLAWMTNAVWFVRLASSWLSPVGVADVRALGRSIARESRSRILHQARRPAVVALGAVLFVIGLVPVVLILRFMFWALGTEAT